MLTYLASLTLATALVALGTDRFFEYMNVLIANGKHPPNLERYWFLAMVNGSMRTLSPVIAMLLAFTILMTT